MHAANMWLLAAVAAVAATSAPTAARADANSGNKSATYDVRQFVCAIGSKTFQQDVGYSAFSPITLPDGSWVGDTAIDVQIPVCPDDGLVLLPDVAKGRGEGEGNIIRYADFSAAERASGDEI